ncbi:MAG: hypothetical protein JWL77_6983 [Chthonomonadaceae bacterium]|nr:hypothetical protein [Chthonomonadaceae bacterium]
MRTILILLSVLVFNQHSFAQSATEMDAVQAALDSRNDFVNALENKDFTALTHKGFDLAIRELAQQLRDEHQDNVMADDLLNQWTQSSANFAAEIEFRLGQKDLGDHAPLFPWIQDFLKKMADKYGTIIYSIPLVQNIQMINLAIPVVFAPRSTSWQVVGVDSRIEYRKHFIPFANLITYYVSLYGCKYILAHNGVTQGANQLCTKAAEKLKFVMGRYIAPVVSDWIFKQSNQSIQIGADRLRYTTAEELQHAIQH